MNVLTKSRHDYTGGTSTPHGLYEYFWSTILLFIAGTINVVLFTQDTVRGVFATVIALQMGDATGPEKLVSPDKLQITDL